MRHAEESQGRLPRPVSLFALAAQRRFLSSLDPERITEVGEHSSAKCKVRAIHKNSQPHLFLLCSIVGCFSGTSVAWSKLKKASKFHCEIIRLHIIWILS